MYGTFEIFRSLRVQKFYRLRVDPTQGTWSYEEPYDSWRTLQSDKGTGITSDEVNRRLIRDEAIELRIAPSRWRPPEELNHLRKILRTRLDKDEIKIHLRSDLLPDTASVELQKTPYSAFLVTNNAARVEIRRRGATRSEVDFAGHFLVDGRLPRLDRDSLSNHLGVDVVAIERRRIVLVRQGARSTLSPELLAPSGSGSADWKDVGDRRDLGSVVKHAMMREMCEELGINRRSAPEISQFRLIGYARLTHLGGKPQFYGVCRVSERIRERVTSKEERYTDDFSSIDIGSTPTVTSTTAAIKKFMTLHQRELSLPLHVNLLLASDWLEQDHTAAAWLGISPS
jgi:hypothetical protein